jgi:hypothetical protein
MRSEWKSYVILLRPKGLFLPGLLMALPGYVLGVIEHPSTAAAIGRDLALLYFAFAIGLVAGCNAFNSANDQDTGPVTLIDGLPPPPPRHLGAFSLIVMATGVALFATRGATPAILAAVIMTLAIFYSWPVAASGFRRLKNVPIGDAMVNGVGYGALASLLGYSLNSDPFQSTSALAVGIAYGLWVIAIYPVTQIFQLDPRRWREAPRSYSTLLGPALALRLSVVFAIASWALLAATVDARLLRLEAGVVASGAYLVYCGAMLFAIVAMARQSRDPFSGGGKQARWFLPTVLLMRSGWLIAHVLEVR